MVAEWEKRVLPKLQRNWELCARNATADAPIVKSALLLSATSIVLTIANAWELESFIKSTVCMNFTSRRRITARKFSGHVHGTVSMGWSMSFSKLQILIVIIFTTVIVWKSRTACESRFSGGGPSAEHGVGKVGTVFRC